MHSWGVSDSLKLYNIENWGDQYFSINPSGNLMVHPRRGEGMGIDLMNVIEEIRSQNMQMPVLIRFQDVIRHRVVSLNEAFKKSIAEFSYRGRYQGVYPIKVNQMREVVEEIIDAGRPYDMGLEAGSKGELAAVIAMNLSPDALIICNGYKDYGFIKMALMGVKIGKRVIIVIEKLTELYQIIAVARELGVTPLVGIRTKLSSKGSGKWESSGGESAKFGLTTPELLHAVNVLRTEGYQDSFKLLHFHIGSQITNIKTVKDAVKEATRVYSKLHKMGMKLEFIDVGGGLGVDYDGSRTSFDSSINYSMAEYVSDVVYSIKEICEAEEVPEPNIVSESGRALVAQHSELVTNVFGSIEVGATPFSMEETADEDDVVKEMRYLSQNLTSKNLLEHFHDALQRKEEALSMFKLGFLSLEDKARVEHLFWQICKVIYKNAAGSKYVPDEVAELNKHLSDQYLCNFSLFQSMPDHWAIQQMFPIIPIHRLDEEPMRQATLVDITCDSDGKVAKFIDLRDIKDTLQLHQLRGNEPYFLGFFLIGAYQDIMGDMHNLFGRVHEVHVFLDETEPGGYYIEEVIRGETIADVLAPIQYPATDLAKRVKEQIDAKAREGLIKPKEGVEFANFYEQVLHGYTYGNFERQTPFPQSAETKGTDTLNGNNGHNVRILS
ncbi:MAG: arginine decarboxylase [Bdellovibrionales bacterium GWB1_52_6]|nr:MAG: arginine decarboxylase [Bdellovibrionales bacterium GWB1_52_6]